MLVPRFSNTCEGPSLVFDGESYLDFFRDPPSITVKFIPSGRMYKSTGFCVSVRMANVDLPLTEMEFGLPRLVVRGEGSTHRLVYHYVRKEHALPVRAGLTVHSQAGTWSSWPPHEFEVSAYAAPLGVFSNFEEVFAYITDPPDSWGVQVVFPVKGEKEALFFADRSTFNVPLGAHPVVAAPEARLAYVWVYSGGREKLPE